MPLEKLTTNQFYPCCELARLGLHLDLFTPRALLECALAIGIFERGGLVLGSPSEVEGAKHRNIDAKTGKHELNRAEHERSQGGASQIANKIDDVDLPESNNANHTASSLCQFTEPSIVVLLGVGWIDSR